MPPGLWKSDVSAPSYSTVGLGTCSGHSLQINLMLVSIERCLAFLPSPTLVLRKRLARHSKVPPSEGHAERELLLFRSPDLKG
jgi:hypothetical protein